MRLFLKAILALSVAMSVVNPVKAQLLADFSANITSGCAPILVQFSDQSTGNPTSWTWNLGNGTTSNVQNPSTTYFTPGSYAISLTVTNASGTDTKTITGFISVVPTPVVQFTSNDSGLLCVPQTILFTDNSNTGSPGTVSYIWDFGDGNFSSALNPSHSYANSGNYSVSLSVTNGAGCSASLTKPGYLQLLGQPNAGFNAVNSNSCTAPFTVNFSNTSTNYGSCVWDFGDGTTSTLANPTHTYTNNGSYTVSLSIANAANCTDTLVQSAFVNIGGLNVSFSKSAASACTNNAISFANTSSPGAGASIWYFGDGTQGTGTSISHSYAVAGSYNVKLVVNYNNCSDSMTQVVTINSGPSVQFSSSDTVACAAPHTVQFNNTTTGATSYTWFFGDGQSSTTTSPSHTYSALGNYTVMLVAISSNGCRDTLVRTNYIRIAQPTLQLTYANATGCGAPATIAFGINGSTTLPVTSYSWDFGDGATGSGGPATTHTYTSTGLYTVTLTYSLGTGCTFTATTTVNVGTMPTAGFSFTPVTPCPQQTVNFTNTSVGGSGTTYSWSFGDGGASVLANPTHAYTTPGNYTVSLIANNYGCKDTFALPITVSPPSAQFTPVYSCTNRKTVTFNNTSIGGTSYLWNFGDGNISTLQSPVHAYNNFNTYNVTLTVVNAVSGCSTIKVQSVILFDLKAQFTAADSNTCTGVPVVFTAATSSFYSSYIWTFGTTSITTTSNTTTRIYANTGLYNTALVVKDIRNCYDTLSKPNYVHVNGHPAAAFSMLPTQGCAPLSVAFTDQSSPAIASLTRWLWQFGDGSSDTTTVPVATHLYNTGTYTTTLTVTDANGCTDSVVLPNSITIHRPTASFSSADTNRCTGQTISFMNNSSGTGLTYHWLFGDGATATTTNPTHTYLNAGNYTVTLSVTDSFGCSDTFTRSAYIHIGNITVGFIASDTFANCPPLAVNFTDTSSNVVTYNWTFGNGNASSVASPSTIYTYPGVYTVQLKGQNSAGCLDSFSRTITVLGPTGTLSYTPLGGCSPLTVQFSSVNSNTQSLIWDMNNGVTQTTTASSTTYTYTTPGVYLPKLLLSDGNSCLVPISGPDTIRVDSVSADFSFTGNNACQTATISFIDTAVFSVTSITAIYWDFGDGNSSTVHNPSHFYSAPGTYNVKLGITTAEGCSDTVIKPVTILAAPGVSAGNDTSFCLGATNGMQLQATGAINYNWSPAATLSCTACANPLASPVNPTTYTVVGTAQNGCTDTAQITLAPNASPVLTASSIPAICEGDSTQLQINGASSYSWTPVQGLSCSACSNPYASPATSTNYSVIGTDINGCSDTLPVAVVVHSLPSVVVQSGAMTICNGDSLQLQASGATNYNWAPNTDISCVGCAAPFVHPSVSRNYIVTGTDINGCSDTAQVSISVNPIPVLAASGQSICSGDSVQLAISGAAIYSWSPAATLSCSNCSNPFATPASTTTYIITGTDTNGCSDTGSITVQVNPLPSLTVSSNSTICPGSSVQLLAAGASSYSWSPSSGLSCSNCSNPYASPVATTTYTVTGTSTFGCTDTEQVTVTVNSSPTVTITSTSTSICAGDSVVLAGSGAASYSWSPSGSLSCVNCSNPVAYPSTTSTYTVIGAAGNNCVDTTQISITVNPLPTINTGGNQSICFGQSVQLQTSGASAYSWTPATGLSCNTCSSPVVQSDTSVTYTIMGTSAAGCTSSQQVTVTVIPLPVLTITSDTAICEGLSLPLQVSGALNYLWSPSSVLSCINCSNPLATPDTTTKIAVIGTDANGCSDTVDMTVAVYPKPDVDAGTDVAVCMLDTVVLHASGASTYQWTPGNYLSCINCDNPSAYPAATTVYTLKGTDTLGCSSTDDIAVTIYPLPEISAGSDQTACRGEQLQLIATGGVSYIWTPDTYLSCTSCANPLTHPDSSVTYTISGTDIHGCQDSGRLTVTVIQPQPFSVSSNDTICKGASVMLAATGGDSYKWSPSDGLNNANIGSPQASPDTTTTYTVLIKQGTCFTDTAYVTVHVSPLPEVNAGPDVKVLAGTPVPIKIQVKDAVSYEWTPATELSCSDCPEPTATPKENTTYTITVASAAGCKAQDDITIFISCDNSLLFMANTFTPNGDGNNDRFYPQGRGIASIKRFTVFSRWGDIVYDARDIAPNDVLNGWDGTYKGEYVKPDVFIYVVEAICDSGFPVEAKGDISLIR
jgi:gliding motility-associated-like protein